jgi:hypothetical protein
MLHLVLYDDSGLIARLTSDHILRSFAAGITVRTVVLSCQARLARRHLSFSGMSCRCTVGKVWCQLQS